MRRLFVLGVVLFAVVVVAAFVGFVVLDRGGAPSVARVKAFDAKAARTKSAEAGRKLDAVIASLDVSPGRVRAGSDVDACYADQQQEGFSSGYYNKTCFRRKVLLVSYPTPVRVAYDKLHIQFATRWSLSPKRDAAVCFSEGIAVPKDRDPRAVALDFIVRPSDAAKMDRTLACLVQVGQVAGVSTIRPPASERNLVFDRDRTFDDVGAQEAVVRERFPTIARIGLTVQYFSERII